MENRLTRRSLLAALPASLLASSAARTQEPDPGLEWPQWRGPSRDGQWREEGLLSSFPERQLRPRWRVPVSNGYSGPTVAGGRVYVTDRVVEPREQERILCFDWQSGRALWFHAYDCSYGGVGYPNGPRASVTVHDGRAYCLGAVGHLLCLDAATGAVLWRRDLNTEYGIVANDRMPIWGLAAAPLLHRGVLLVQAGGAPDACFVGLDAATGRERWRALPDPPSYAPPVLVRQQDRDVAVCWSAERVAGLDPATGAILWSEPFPSVQTVIAIATPVVDGDHLFLTSFYQGSLMLRLLPDRLAVERVWARRGQNEISTDALHSIISTPLMFGGHVYGVDSYGELRCLDARNGDRVWSSTAAVPRARWSTIHLVRNAERVWMFNERGDVIIARLSPRGYDEVARAHLLKPTTGQLPQRGGVCWAHPAFAYRHIFARNDEELVCASLEAT